MVKPLLLAASLAVFSSVALAKDITVTFTDNEAQAVINYADVATKTGGLQVAPTALAIVQKLQQAAQAPEPSPAPKSTDKGQTK